ncbi:MAG TPA: fumarylacetoacetate hydrolase family protein [Candidatus Angelobacter sp.]|jgi:2-keto-4-pentenoate hydratase/2-oxohepta-3-ene-1,7-dioic acid hydratase in catechol pathway|nr:fumarylacetoacetate hydrolase family protein [Candidatus Angelobacter sp.]
MRLGNLRGRAVLLAGTLCLDVAEASAGLLPAAPGALLRDWDRFVLWARSTTLQPSTPFDPAQLGPPVPRPRQVFAVALNYPQHAGEAQLAVPEVPLIFTKFPGCIAGPGGTIALPQGNVDWELELVVVIARDAYRIAEESAWDAVAGVTVGQDISERRLQLNGAAPQYSLGKSYPGFGPIGPAIVTVDELPDRDDLELRCVLSGEEVQHDRTSSMVFSVPRLIAHISAVCPLYAGDLVFTGTPAGVGNRRSPQRFITAGDELVSRIEHVGEMRHRFAATQESATVVQESIDEHATR